MNTPVLRFASAARVDNMSRKTGLLLATAVVMFTVSEAVAETKSEKPNIIVILVDDLGNKRSKAKTSRVSSLC